MTQLEHQDWKPVILRRNQTRAEVLKEGISKAIANGEAYQERKMNAGTNKQNKTDVLARKIESDNYVLPKVTADLSKQISQARCNKKWTQDEFAKRCALSVKTVRDYENPQSGVVIKQQDLNKMANILGVRLKKQHVPKKPVE